MACFLGVPEKRTDPVNLCNSLADILAPSVDYKIRTKFIESLKQLDKLRSDAISGHQRLASGITLDEALSRYIDQLVYLEAAVPPQHLQVAFVWRNAFSIGSVVVYHIPFTQNTLSFEKICVLFNLAAFLSQRAARTADSIEEPNGLREAARLFQRSAGLFQYIRHVNSVSAEQGITGDLRLRTLQSLENLCLAQAQECVYLKTLRDGKSASLLARLAERTRELYETAWKHMSEERACSYQWMYVMQFKETAFKGATQFHQAIADGEEGRVGDELARLALSMKAFRVANKHAENITTFVIGPHWRDMCKQAEQLHTKRHRENDCIYKERVTLEGELPAISAAVVAKIIPLEMPLTSQENLFEGLPQQFKGESTECDGIPLD